MSRVAHPAFFPSNSKSLLISNKKKDLCALHLKAQAAYSRAAPLPLPLAHGAHASALPPGARGGLSGEAPHAHVATARVTGGKKLGEA